jgi:hypothetical protein
LLFEKSGLFAGFLRFVDILRKFVDIFKYFVDNSGQFVDNRQKLVDISLSFVDTSENSKKGPLLSENTAFTKCLSRSIGEKKTFFSVPPGFYSILANTAL